MTHKVLVADDESAIANVVAKKLTNAGLQVIVAMDGQEAYELARADPPDFLITDLQMPRMGGLELVARLANELPREVPTILLTAKGFEISRASVAHLPICRIMTKPFSPRELLTCVQEKLGLCVTQ
jgi:DNA-binding response OmpR family regulator